MFKRRYIPNYLSLSRMLLALYFPFFPESLRLEIAVIALLTEYFDGALSRWFKWESPLGALLDPIADKMFVLAVLLTIFSDSGMFWWQFLLIISRDLIVFLGALYLLILEKNTAVFWRVRPRFLGKVATAFQFLFMVSFLYMNKLNGVFLTIAMLTSLSAGMDYLYLLFKHDFYRGKSPVKI